MIAGRDPGSANWLDTQGRAEVLTTARWFRPPAPPTIHAEVVPFAKLADHLPDGHPMVDADARAAEIRGRSAHVAWRYRT